MNALRAHLELALRVRCVCTETGAYVAAAISRPTGCKYRAIVLAASTSSPTNEQMQAACSATEASCNEDASVAGPGRETSWGQIPASCAYDVPNAANAAPSCVALATACPGFTLPYII